MCYQDVGKLEMDGFRIRVCDDSFSLIKFICSEARFGLTLTGKIDKLAHVHG